MASTPVTLTALSEREAVADALYRCLKGLDSNDHALFASACLQTPEMTFFAGPITFNGWDTINGVMTRLFDLATTHMTSNVRVELKGAADTAKLSCHTMAYHVLPEQVFEKNAESYTSACLYDFDMVRDGGDGLWKIKIWKANILWTTGDRKVLFPGNEHEL